MKDMKITGTVSAILPTREGESAKGAWISGGFVIEFGDEYIHHAAFTVFGQELVSQVKNMSIGLPVTVTFRPQSREYNGRWYTDLMVTKVENAAAPAKPVQDLNNPAYEDDGLEF